MQGPGLTEILIIAGVAFFPCLGILVVGGIAAVIFLLVRKNKQTPS